jgi:ribosome-associated translation inhibitor RaiA
MTNDFDLLKLAAMTAGALKKVDEDTIQRTSNGPALRIDPRSFTNQNQVQQTQNQHKLIPNDIFVEQPKSRLLGSEVHGTVNVDLNSLMIPIPEEFKKSHHMVDINLPASSSPAIVTNSISENKLISNSLDIRINKLEKKINKIIRLLTKNGN